MDGVDGDSPSLPLATRVGYALKRAAATLRAEMDEGLRPLGLTVPQYACLSLLVEQPALSSAELARGAFVSRQSMNLVLRSLDERGLVSRAGTAVAGRSLPARLTESGHRMVEDAAAIVADIESRMVDVLAPERRQLLRADLMACSEALAERPRR